jgi:sugar phosphate isomerase/epimerase
MMELFERWSRRDFLWSGSVALAPALLSRLGDAAANGPTAKFPAEPKARLAVTSYPFRAYIESPANHDRNPKLPAMDIAGFPRFVSENFGVFNINPLLVHFRSTELAYLETFRRALEQAHSHIVDLGLGGKQFYASDPLLRQTAVEYGRHGIDVAVQVGSPSVRQHISGAEKTDVERAAGSLGRVAEYGAKRNIVVNLENDNPIPENPFFLVSVIEKVDNPYLRALPDFGNSLIGHDNNYNRRAMQAMLPHAYNMCHVKDVVTDDHGRQFHVDLGTLFNLAKQSGFKGYFSMEYETEGGNPIAGTKGLVEASMRYLS